jgi:hypothetical protein
VITATVTPPRFPAHVADRVAASYRPARSNLTVCPECNGIAGPNHSCPRYVPGDSDPSADELLRRVKADAGRREIAGAA